MRSQFVSALLFLSALTPQMTQASSSAPRLIGDLPNFSQVTPSLLRGGQPTKIGFEKLKEKGVKTIISLRHNKYQVASEEKEVRALGMKFQRIPMDGLHKPSDKAVAQFLSLVKDPANQPVFVHCQFGADRTGTLIGIYREEVDHWTAKRAYDEMLAKGFETKYAWLADAVFDYEEDKIHVLSNERPLNVKVLDSLQTTFNLRPNYKVSSESSN